jgi:hypothetical protein
MCTSRPAAGPTLAFFQLFPGPANSAFSGRFLLGILDPADELVAGQRRDVLPGVECDRVVDQRHTQVSGKLVHDPTGNSQVAHVATLASQIGQESSLRLGIHIPYAAEIVGHGRGDRTGPAHRCGRLARQLDIAFLQVKTLSPCEADSAYNPTQASTLTVGQLLVTTTVQGALRTT